MPSTVTKLGRPIAYPPNRDVMVAEEFAFAYDATPSALPVYTAEQLEGGHLSSVDMVFGDPDDEEAALPDTMTVAVNNSNGVTIASGTLTATGRLPDFAPQEFIGDLFVTLTGNTVASAVGKCILNAF